MQGKELILLHFFLFILTDRVSKAIWFFFPIGILLLINLAMFFVTAIELIRLDYHVRKRRKLQLKVTGTRREMLER